MPSSTNDKRKVRIWTWIWRVKKFEKERAKLISYYHDKGDEFWEKILRQIYVPYFDWNYINNPAVMPAQFFVPGFYRKGEAIESFQCEAGLLSQVFMLMMYVAGYTDQTIPRRIQNLMKLLE